MPYVKVVKNASYFKRYQVKPKRRREGKTNYTSRKKLCVQKLTEMDTKKYRLIVRITNKSVICQIAEASSIGDIILESAESAELPRYGIKCGLKNWASTYCVGLLLARRVLHKLGMDKVYEGVVDPDGQDYNVEPVDNEQEPFYCVMDVGLKAKTTGAKIFAALKGATDGGLDIPHDETRFVGYDKESKNLDAEVLKGYIFGEPVANYMRTMKDDEPEKYEKQFSHYIKEGIDPDDLEELYRTAHRKIREDPRREVKEKRDYSNIPSYKTPKLSYEERKERLRERIEKLEMGDDEADE